MKFIESMRCVRRALVLVLAVLACVVVACSDESNESPSEKGPCFVDGIRYPANSTFFHCGCGSCRCLGDGVLETTADGCNGGSRTPLDASTDADVDAADAADALEAADSPGDADAADGDQ